MNQILLYIGLMIIYVVVGYLAVTVLIKHNILRSLKKNQYIYAALSWPFYLITFGFFQITKFIEQPYRSSFYYYGRNFNRKGGKWGLSFDFINVFNGLKAGLCLSWPCSTREYWGFSFSIIVFEFYIYTENYPSYD